MPKVTGLISRNRYSCFVYHLVSFHRILRRIADSFDRGKDKGCKLCSPEAKVSSGNERELEINFKAILVTSIYFV